MKKIFFNGRWIEKSKLTKAEKMELKEKFPSSFEQIFPKEAKDENIL